MGLTQEERNALDTCIARCLDSAMEETPEPPDPPDPPLPGDCKDGYLAGTGNWQGWCIQYRSKFLDGPGDVMRMLSNSKGARKIFPGPTAHGIVRLKGHFPGDNIPQGGGGKHWVEITNAHKAMGSPIGSGGFYKNWFRPDIQPVNGEWRIHTYSADENGAAWFVRGSGKDYVCDVWDTNVPIPGVKQWFDFEFEWQRQGVDKMGYRLKCNGVEAKRGIGSGTPVTIHHLNQNPQIAVVGNMDSLSNFGGVAECWYRAFAWASL